jgi:hypothetical protein
MMKTTDLPLPRSHQTGPWIMRVPVISMAHIPQSEAEALLNFDPEDEQSAGPDDPPLLAHIANQVGHLFLIEDIDEDDLPEYPHLRAVLIAVKARGYSYARLDAQGEIFEDLPQFDW